MRVYVAGKTHEFERVRRVQDLLRSNGHEITYDWTRTVEIVGPDHEHGITPEQELQAAENDYHGVKNAELLIALYHPAATGTLVEVGMAIAFGIPIWMVGWEERPSVFWHLFGVRMVDNTKLFDDIPRIPLKINEQIIGGTLN